jgi:hypothetical protein
VALVAAQPAAAQRSGFIIGFGLGGGWSKVEGADGDFGLATDFKIGAQVSETARVYYSGKSVLFGVTGADLGISGIQGVGVDYVLPSGMYLSGGVGLANLNILLDGSLEGDSGFGLNGGVGYEFGDLWMVDFDLTWGTINSASVLTASVSVNILSH